MGDVTETRCPIGPGGVICVTGWFRELLHHGGHGKTANHGGHGEHGEQRFVVVACRTSRCWAAHPPRAFPPCPPWFAVRYFPEARRSKRGFPLSGAKVGSIRSQPGER